MNPYINYGVLSFQKKKTIKILRGIMEKNMKLIGIRKCNHVGVEIIVGKCILNRN